MKGSEVATAATPEPRLRGEIGVVLALWGASRLVLLVALALSPGLRLAGGDTPADPATAASRWDAAWLLELAADGYREPRQAAFFPAFPTAVRGLEALLGQRVWAATGLNLVLSLAAALLLHSLARRTLSRDGARLAVAVVLFHPLSFYLLVPYTEALFLTASLAAVSWAARDRQRSADLATDAAAGLAAAVATLTRNTGVLLVLPLGWLARTRRSDRVSRLASLGLLVGLPLLALAGYMTFTAVRFGDPLLFVHAQESWSGHIQPALPFDALVRDLGRRRAWLDHHLPLALLALWLAWRVVERGFREGDPRLSRAYALLVVPPLLLSFSLSKLAITPRLHLVLFPLWIEAGGMLSRWPRWVQVALLTVSATTGAWLTLRFSQGLWVD